MKLDIQMFASPYVTFEDTPSTNTPLSSANLNKIQTDARNEIGTLSSLETTDKTSLVNALNSIIESLVPTGSISVFAGSTAPNGWLICDGSAVSRTTYANLFSIIGTTYGDGDGSTTFSLPNLKGRVIVGQDTSDTDFDVIGETGGEKQHTLTIAEMPSHNHKTFGLYAKIGSGTIENTWLAWSSGNAAVQNAGGNQPHNILQPYMVQNYIIKY